MQKKILIFCDGACSGNPGPGGWGAIVCSPEGKVKELGGGEPSTTNNRMELIAALEALKQVATFSDPVQIYSDSKYVVNGMKGWVFGWQKNGLENR